MSEEKVCKEMVVIGLSDEVINHPESSTPEEGPNSRVYHQMEINHRWEKIESGHNFKI